MNDETAQFVIKICRCEYGHELVPQGAIVFTENADLPIPTGPDARYCPVCVFSWLIQHLDLKPMKLFDKQMELPRELFDRLLVDTPPEEV